MPLAKAVLKREPEATPLTTAVTPNVIPARLPNIKAGIDHASGTALRTVAAKPPQRNGFAFQPRVPVITGEVTYRGYLPIDGIVSGLMNGTGGGLTIKQRPRNVREPEPELDGDICFKDMLRINGHVAGRVLSDKGTLIVDSAARIDAFIEVGVAVISGVVNGDIVGRERVELGHGAVIHGNILTPKLSIKPGATFQGDCRMLKTAD
jgi:cytoskeletal protein CcmA (bactofilin family)